MEMRQVQLYSTTGLVPVSWLEGTESAAKTYLSIPLAPSRVALGIARGGQTVLLFQCHLHKDLHGRLEAYLSDPLGSPLSPLPGAT